MRHSVSVLHCMIIIIIALTLSYFMGHSVAVLHCMIIIIIILTVGKLDYDHGMLMCASAVVTASLASFILGLIMVIVIILAR